MSSIVKMPVLSKAMSVPGWLRVMVSRLDLIQASLLLSRFMDRFFFFVRESSYKNVLVIGFLISQWQALFYDFGPQ
jgi:hypothetical protein